MAVYRTFTDATSTHTAPSAPVVAQPELRRWLPGRIIVKAALLLVLAFVVSVTLLRALPDDKSDLRALLTPPVNCAMPCWNGIQPGITMVDEAVTALEANPFVADYQVTPGKISWWWNGDQPDALDSSGRAFHGRMEYAQVNGQDRITSIILDTTRALGDVQVALGDPQSITLHMVNAQNASQRAGAVYIAHYDAMSVFVMLDCPMNVDDFWRSSAYVAFGTPTFAFAGQTFQLDSLPNRFFRDQASVCAAS